MRYPFGDKISVGDVLPPAADYRAGDWFYVVGDTYYWHDGTQWNPLVQPPPIQYYEVYGDVRADTPVAPIVLVGGRLAVGDGGAGFFSKDNSFPLGDNDGTVLVDASGNKWVRVFGDTVSAKWFITKGTTVLAGSAQANQLYDLVETYHGHRRIEWSDIDLQLGGTVDNANVFVMSTITAPAGANIACTSTRKARFELCTFDPAGPLYGSYGFDNFEFSGCTFNAPNTNSNTANFISIARGNVYNSRFEGPDNLTRTGTANYGFWAVVATQGTRITNCYINNLAMQLRTGSIAASIRNRIYTRDSVAGAWTENLSVDAGSILESSIFEWDIQAFNRIGIGVVGGRVQNSTFLLDVLHAGSGSNPVPLNTVTYGFVNNNSIIYRRTDTGITANIIGLYVNAYNPSVQRSVLSNYIYVENADGTADGVMVIAGNTVTMYPARMLIAQNVIENGGAVANGRGIALVYSVSSIHMEGNNIINFNEGISKNSGQTIPDITGNSNRFVNCITNIAHADYVNTTVDGSW